MLRVGEEVAGRALLQDFTFGHEPDAVGHVAREPHLVGHADHRHALFCQRAHHLQHLAHHLGIERAGGLVEQHDRRPHGQRAGNRHALLLAARQRVRIGVGLVGQAHLVEQRHRLFPGFGLAGALELHRRQHAVLERRQVREQVELLEHEADAGTQRVHVKAFGVDVTPVDGDVATVDVFEPVERADQRRLARPRWPAHDQDFIFFHALGDPHQRVIVTVILVDVIENDHRSLLSGIQCAPTGRRCRRRSSRKARRDRPKHSKK